MCYLAQILAKSPIWLPADCLFAGRPNVTKCDYHGDGNALSHRIAIVVAQSERVATMLQFAGSERIPNHF
jgi:hypothetical protein